MRVFNAHMPSRATSRSATVPKQTAWGEWLGTQPPGTLTDAFRETGLAWATVNKARKRLVSREVAEILSKFAKHAFPWQAIAKPPRERKPLPRAAKLRARGRKVAA
jgi:hypothetical protein